MNTSISVCLSLPSVFFYLYFIFLVSMFIPFLWNLQVEAELTCRQIGTESTRVSSTFFSRAAPISKSSGFMRIEGRQPPMMPGAERPLTFQAFLEPHNSR
ncbi:uncharacterized protein A4U43_C03F13540 [Asparagus officinalis]|uniref:Uncharacterized protein n=1 Tax=Asparagus officinalis TaxID=4686 RepID=A0A5P1FCL2_ASPOF|nr:uncharacterized protein A4U43_C03F13540 [Asparagus officinalis]